MKYFLIGAFATGFLLYGIALVYGATGGELSLRRDRRARRPRAAQAPLFIIGECFILVALGFKVAAVPFHMWAPDAYEGAPTPVTGVHGGRRQGGRASARIDPRVRRRRSRSPVLVFGVTGWAIDAVGARGAHDDARQPGGAPPGQRQAHARVLVDRARRLPARRRGGDRAWASPSAQARVLFYLVAYTFTTLGAFGVVAWIGNRKRRAAARRRLGRPRRARIPAWRWR